MTGPRAIKLREKLSLFGDRWAPKVVAELNGYPFKLVKLEGAFVWRDGRVELGPGEVYVVPRGVEHRPVAERECHVMLVEPRGVVNTGDAGGAYTAPGDVRI